MQYYEYSRHGSIESAESALEQMFADGRVCESERPKIAYLPEPRGVRHAKRIWRVMLCEMS